jgi:hypothetical protein
MDHFRLDEHGLLVAGAQIRAAHDIRLPPPPGAGDLPSGRWIKEEFTNVR